MANLHLFSFNNIFVCKTFYIYYNSLIIRLFLMFWQIYEDKYNDVVK